MPQIPPGWQLPLDDPLRETIERCGVQSWREHPARVPRAGREAAKILTRIAQR